MRPSKLFVYNLLNFIAVVVHQIRVKSCRNRDDRDITLSTPSMAAATMAQQNNVADVVVMANGNVNGKTIGSPREKKANKGASSSCVVL